MAFTTEHAPAETVDDTDHRIERIRKSPLLWNDAGAKPHRRDIEAQLDNEWNDVTEIPVFDVERRDPHPDAEARDERNGGEHRQQQDLPARNESIPDHER